jgi:hypothetical protein
LRRVCRDPRRLTNAIAATTTKTHTAKRMTVTSRCFELDFLVVDVASARGPEMMPGEVAVTVVVIGAVGDMLAVDPKVGGGFVGAAVATTEPCVGGIGVLVGTSVGVTVVGDVETIGAVLGESVGVGDTVVLVGAAVVHRGCIPSEQISDGAHAVPLAADPQDCPRVRYGTQIGRQPRYHP